MYEIIAITVAIVISILNFMFTYAVAKVVYEHTKAFSLSVRAISLLTEFYHDLITPTDKEDKE